MAGTTMLAYNEATGFTATFTTGELGHGVQEGTEEVFVSCLR